MRGAIMDAIADQFLAAIEAATGARPPRIEADGALHRFPTNSRPGDDAGWYILFTDGIAAGAFGCWRSGIREDWRADIGRRLSPAGERAYRERMKAVKALRDADAARRHKDAAARAARIWEAAQPANRDHPYLRRKNVEAHGLRQHRGRLVIPARDTDGALHSLQFIDDGGGKKFLKGGGVKGCFHLIGGADATLCICEGYATGASLHAATGHAVAVAFDAGNLEPVAKAIRA